MPVYYRLNPGNIRDVKAFRNCLLEENAVLVADKGFYSKENVGLLSGEDDPEVIINHVNSEDVTSVGSGLEESITNIKGWIVGYRIIDKKGVT